MAKTRLFLAAFSGYHLFLEMSTTFLIFFIIKIAENLCRKFDFIMQNATKTKYYNTKNEKTIFSTNLKTRLNQISYVMYIYSLFFQKINLRKNLGGFKYV